VDASGSTPSCSRISSRPSWPPPLQQLDLPSFDGRPDPEHGEGVPRAVHRPLRRYKEMYIKEMIESSG